MVVNLTSLAVAHRKSRSPSPIKSLENRLWCRMRQLYTSPLCGATPCTVLYKPTVRCYALHSYIQAQCTVLRTAHFFLMPAQCSSTVLY